MQNQNRFRLGQNKISHLFLNGSDLQNREKEVLQDACKKTGFKITKLMDRSSWWTSKEIGAFRYQGEFEGKNAVLKIQGVKPTTSEIYMIQSFAKVNKSKIIRPPVLYDFIEWDDEKRYEALILEYVEGTKIVNSPAHRDEIKDFFNLREEYKKNCVVNPWIDKPNESLSEEIRNNFEKWKQSSFKLYPIHLLRDEGDGQLIGKAIDILVREYVGVEREFQHGHFGVSDLLRISQDEVIILSNLYWSWKPPFYDAVFGYHWFMYGLGGLENITPQLIEEQRSLWLSHFGLHLKGVKLKLLNLALLERAAAGLNLDALSIGSKSPIAEYLVERTRKELIRLIGQFK